MPSYSTETSGLTEVAQLYMLKGSALSLPEVEVEIFVLQNNRYSLQDLPLPPLLVTKPTTWIELQSNLNSEVLSL